ncbi:MAG: hypothetical protein LQ339_003222 [Xanthoria mediterranea]|nr:MAG: hypothetical protein LQ339_003222 [Xanthoria mediterranea]
MDLPDPAFTINDKDSSWRASSPATDVEMATSDGSKTPPEKVPSPRDVHGWKWAVVVASILSSTFLFSLDNTIVADVQPAIFQRFDEIDTLAWLGVAFALGSAATILPWCKAYGVFNVKWLYIFHVLLFEVGSALCGGANTMNALIVGRAIAGVGGCGMYVGCLTYLSITTSMQERPVYMGSTGLIWGVGTVLGPVVGGAFADSSATWRWAFYINLVIGAIFAPAFFFLLPSIDLQAGVPLKEKILKMTDWFGIAIFNVFIICFVMAVSFGGTYYEWDSGPEITFWVLGGVFFVAFCFTQVYHPFVVAHHKLYPTHFLKRPVLVILQIMIFCASGCTFTPTYYIPLFFQFALGDSALQAAVRLLPFICMLVLFALLNGSLMAKFGYYMPWYLFGGALILVGSSLMYTLDSDTSASAVYGYSVLIGIGTGSFLQASYGVSQALVDPGDIPNAIGFISIGQSIGVVLFLSVAGTIFNNEAIKAVTPILVGVSETEVEGAIAGTSSSIFETLDEATRARVVEAIIQSLDKVYGLIIGGGALVFILAFFLPRQKLFMAATAAG